MPCSQKHSDAIQVSPQRCFMQRRLRALRKDQDTGVRKLQRPSRAKGEKTRMREAAGKR